MSDTSSVWMQTTLNKIASITSGGTPSRSCPTYWGGDIPWLSTSQIDFNVVCQAKEFITEEGLANSSAKLLPIGTILMAMYGQGMTRGRVAMLGIMAATNQACAAILVNDSTDYRFVYYCLEHQYTDIRELGHGGNQKNLNQSLVGDIRLPLPPLPEQRKIAEILGTWDAAITRVEQLIVALQQRKQGLMQRLLTGQVRFPEFEGEAWTIEKACNIFEQRSRRNNGNEELLSVTQEQGVVPRSMLDARVTMPSGATDSYKLVEPGDFIISLRSFQGGIEYSEYRGLVSPAYTVLKPKLPIAQGFYKHLLKSHDFIGRLGVAIIGIRDGKQINYADFASLRLAYPSLEEQKAIAILLDTCDTEIHCYQRQLQALRQQKKGLMQRLLTGQVRVTV